MDVERFIELVRDRPCLYDNKDALSKNKNEKEKCWKEIGTAMGITSELAKCKWKNLKNNYTKHIKGTTATSGYYLKYLHWNWAPHMEFMKPHLHYISTLTNGLKDQENQDEEETEHVDSAQSSTRSDEWSEDMPIDDKIHCKSHAAQQDQFPPTRKLIQCMDEVNSYDATDLIFLGYAKTIKDFSVRRQAQIKLKLAKIIMEEELAHYEEVSVYPEDSPSYIHLPSSPQNDPLNSKGTHVQVKTEDY